MLVDRMIDRLADDHRHANRLAVFVRDAGLRVAGAVDTSTVLAETPGDVGAFVAALARHGLLHHPPKGRRIRFVADVAADIAEAGRGVLASAREVAPQRPPAQ